MVHLSQDSEVPRAWWIGGGTILAARWEHRQSWDIDILISEKTKGNGAEEALKSIATELRHRGAAVDLEIPHGWMHARHQDPGGAERQRGIDIWVKEPRLRAEVEVERIGNYDLPTLPTSQILYGKLLRGTGEIARDAYDIAHAHGKDPAALESAVNSVSWTLQRRNEILWHTGRGHNRPREERNPLTGRQAGARPGGLRPAGRRGHPRSALERSANHDSKRPAARTDEER